MNIGKEILDTFWVSNIVKKHKSHTIGSDIGRDVPFIKFINDFKISIEIFLKKKKKIYI